MHLALVQVLHRARGSPECAQIPFDGPIRNCSRRSTLWARLRRYAFCTDSGITFLGSPFPYLPFHMHFPLVETLYRARGSPECAHIRFDCFLRNCSRRSSFRVRPRWYAFCTFPGFTFSGFPSPYVPFHMHIALVQALYRARGNHKCAQMSNDGPMRNCSGRSSLRALPRRYAFCTDPGFTFSGSPSP